MVVKFMLSKKATKIDEIFTVDLTLCSKCQIDGEDFINFCGLLGKHELYTSVFGIFFTESVYLPVNEFLHLFVVNLHK